MWGNASEVKCIKGCVSVLNGNVRVIDHAPSCPNAPDPTRCANCGEAEARHIIVDNPNLDAVAICPRSVYRARGEGR